MEMHAPSLSYADNTHVSVHTHTHTHRETQTNPVTLTPCSLQPAGVSHVPVLGDKGSGAPTG